MVFFPYLHSVPEIFSFTTSKSVLFYLYDSTGIIMKQKFARRSLNNTPYLCQMDWPEDCFVQCGGNGVVFTKENIEQTMATSESQIEALATVVGLPTSKKHYRTAFFEAFPSTPSCFIRGEGLTVEEAEAAAFLKYQKILACTHDYERRNREDGYAYCKLCPLSGTFLEPLTQCFICKKPAHYEQDLKGNWYCEEHYYNLPIDDACEPESDKPALISATEFRQSFREHKAEMNVLRELGYTIGDSKYKSLLDVLMRYKAQIAAKNKFEKDSTLKLSEEILNEQFIDPTVIQSFVKEILKQLPKLAL